MRNYFSKTTIFVFVLLFGGCASLRKKTSEKQAFHYGKERFFLTDLSGKYILNREVGRENGKNSLVVKQSLVPSDGLDHKKNAVETNITISDLGVLKGMLPVLRPRISQYTVWFDKKKYFTEMKMSIKEKNLVVRLDGPDEKSKSLKTYPFPNGSGVYCFFSQLTECVKATKFISNAIEHKAGEMHLYVIWNGYPYFQQQYTNIPEEVFSPAVMVYDGQNKKGEHRFSLNVAGQSIFYFTNKKQQLLKIFWVAQGLSMKKTMD